MEQSQPGSIEQRRLCGFLVCAGEPPFLASPVEVLTLNRQFDEADLIANILLAHVK